MRKRLTIFGWVLFVCSLFLPMNISIGGFTDPGEPHSGMIGLFYSLAMIYSLFLEEQDWENRQVILMAGLGFCNLVIFLSPISLLLPIRNAE